MIVFTVLFENSAFNLMFLDVSAINIVGGKDFNIML
jgi:hypothetical protein